MSKHTPGAIRAAEIITGMKYEPGESSKSFSVNIETSEGRKATDEIAEIIDRETAAPELLEAARKSIRDVEKRWEDLPENTATVPISIKTFAALEAAIAKTTGEQTNTATLNSGLTTIDTGELMAGFSVDLSSSLKTASKILRQCKEQIRVLSDSNLSYPESTNATLWLIDEFLNATDPEKPQHPGEGIAKD